MKHINRCLMTAFDRGYGLISRKKTCSKLMPNEVFDGQEYSIDQFYGTYSAFFEKPWDFYRDFKEKGPLRLRDGVHPRDLVAPKVPCRRMIFHSPVFTEWEETNLVPFKWFSDPKRRSKTILLFAPGWGRSSQSVEEAWCYRLQTLGVDCGLLTVPYHQARTPEGSFTGEYFISANMLWTVSNFRHFTAEIRRLIQEMRQEYEYVGLVGMSSGGFQAALASNCEPVDFFFPLITGGQLGSITWHGSITQFVRRDLEKKGIDEISLGKAWSIADGVVLGKHCKAKTIKQYISLYDRVVPTIYQLKLWEALGKPPRMDLECAHYSSFFHGNAVLKDIAETVREHTL
ncbi:MAG: hypothetical protein ACOYM3_20650 [Terrimicrobiaceae bacterium]